MKRTYLIATGIAMLILFSACVNKPKKEKESMSSISTETMKIAQDSLLAIYGDAESFRIQKGVEQCAQFWTEEDGNDSLFIAFCKDNFSPVTGGEKDTLFNRLNHYFEMIYGYYNMMTIELMRNLHEPGVDLTAIDERFGSWDATAHFQEDMFNNQTAFVVLLNFPHYSLEVKNTKGANWTPREWGMARMGDLFTARVPAKLLLKASQTMVAGDNYISFYNIYMGNIRNDANEQVFPDDMVLITHWGLRDELKSHYGEKDGRNKQELIYTIMQRIIDQSIPETVIDNPEVQWQPESNKIFKDGKEIEANAEPDQRYQVLLDNFHVMKELDPYYPFYDNAIARSFDGGLEMSQADVENLFIEFVSSPVIKEVGNLIKDRLGRNLRPYDIWYDGFKSRSGINEAELDKITEAKYPDNVAFKAALPGFLRKLGFTPEKADYIASYIAVDPARGSGHAWGSEMKSDVSHLRTRIAETGMNYKGYNIAVHEFGHNVEQTISMHFVDNYMLHGVPNTAFTEALAFIFQKRDLQLLNMENNDPLAEDMETLDICWSLYEIMGVSLVDMNVWKWMYEHPDATASELKVAVIDISKDIWNKYYAPVFGVKDQTILGIYSHMIDNPLYLSAYPLGYIIQFQVEESIKGKNFAEEVQRIWSQGRLSPDVWIIQATGSKLSTQAILDRSKEAVGKFKEQE